ncbi:MAG: FHA domain-containing protein [Planctomycetes bacterium]|nr:FHA domain-containing protein [Planctomycetota bacterium]
MTDVENAKYDGSSSLELVGKSGLFEGEKARLLVGQCLVVGRSRMCDLSVARTAECQRLGKDALERHRSYRKISRKHLRICLLQPGEVEIEDLSTNGTAVNGHRVDKVLIRCGGKDDSKVVVEFGDGELLELKVAGQVKHDDVEPRTLTGHAPAADAASRDIASGYDRTPVP